MSQPDILYQWFEEVESHMDCLSKPQAFVLSGFSLGIALAKQCTLSAVAQKLFSMGKPETVERRLQRFLSNPRLDFTRCFESLARWVLGSLSSTELVVLLVDETSLKDRLKVMAVSVAYHGKAIPLAWWCYPQEQWFAAAKQVELIRTLLEHLSEAIPEGVNVLVEADRGIGTSPELLKVIQDMGYYFLVRVQRGVKLVMEDDREVEFGDRRLRRSRDPVARARDRDVVATRRLVTRMGESFKGPVYAFKKAGWLKCWSVGEWKAGHDEPPGFCSPTGLWPKATGMD